MRLITCRKLKNNIDFIDIYANLDHNEMERYRKQYPEKENKMTANKPPPLIKENCCCAAELNALLSDVENTLQD